MGNITINSLPAASVINPGADLIPIYQAADDSTRSTSRNTYLGITGNPVGSSDIQTLTNKTLTAPTIGSPTLSGTVAGTYTLGGTPTFPATVVQTTASQTLTDKVLTSPTINSPTITNATISADALTGYTNANNGTLYGISVTASQLSAAALTDGTLTPAKLTAGTGSTWSWGTYTPSWTATTTNPVIGNGTISGNYIQVGKTVWATILVVAGSTTTYGSGVYRWSLPITALSRRFVGSGYALRVTTAFEPWPVSNIDIFGAILTGSVQLINAGGGVSAATRAWSTGDIFALQITYEVA